MPPPPPVRHWRGSVGVGGWETRHSSDEPAAGSSMRPERLRHHPGGGVGSGEDTGGRTSVRAPAPGERLQLRSDWRRRKQGGRGRGCGGEGGHLLAARRQRRTRGGGAAGRRRRGLLGWGRGGISVNRCRFSGWRTAATRAVRKRRAAAQPCERGSAAATQRADGRARRSRRMRAAGTIEARGGADGRARQGRVRRAAGTSEARGGADGRARRGRRTRAAGPTDARGGAD